MVCCYCNLEESCSYNNLMLTQSNTYLKYSLVTLATRRRDAAVEPWRWDLAVLILWWTGPLSGLDLVALSFLSICVHSDGHSMAPVHTMGSHGQWVLTAGQCQKSGPQARWAQAGCPGRTQVCPCDVISRTVKIPGDFNCTLRPALDMSARWSKILPQSVTKSCTDSHNPLAKWSKVTNNL